MKNIKITKPQSQFLTELDKGAVISLCVEPSPLFGEFIGKERFSGNIQKQSVFKLYQSGLVIFVQEFHFGIQYHTFHISDKGRAFLGGVHA